MKPSGSTFRQPSTCLPRAETPRRTRKVVSLQEIIGMEGNIITMQEIFTFEQTGVRPDGTVRGRFKIEGIMPRFIERFRAYGIPLPGELFGDPVMLEI